jgi:geranylgeranyl pyrophosphate synthase
VSLPAWLGAHRAQLDAFMVDWFTDAWPAHFAEPLRYPLFGGGKRMRPALCIAAYQAVASNPDDLAPVLPAAAAVELVHTYSLAHDDLPAMDDDDERRGRPTVHVAWDEATAVLVGDALLTEAFAVLAKAPLPADDRIELVSTLARGAGYRGMIGGQVADIGGVDTLEDLTRLHRLKTGALLRWSAVAGGVCAGADAELRGILGKYGAAIGLAFQLADDVLDAEEDAGDDGPPSFVKLLGVEETLRRAHLLAEEAAALARQTARPDTLVDFARFTVERTL